MSNILSPISCLDIRFIEAVNGYQLSAKEGYELFDQNAAFRRYGRILRPGEVGCTLSHRKCAQAITDGDEPFALICEDDLYLQDTNLEPIINGVKSYLISDKPVVVLLSGDYWYKRRMPLCNKYKIAIVREAVCSQAYLMNRAAANCVLSIGPTYIADDWYSVYTSGVKLLALSPHIADQNRLDFQTEISPAYTGYIKKNLSVKTSIVYYYRAIYKKCLKLLGRFEKHDFKW